MVTPIQYVEISGAPYERGVQYGTLAAERIRLGTEHYLAQLARIDFGMAELAAAVQQYLPSIEKFDPAYPLEMRGIAQGRSDVGEEVVPGDGFEPPTLRFSVACSTN